MAGNILIISKNSLHLTKRAVASALAQDVPCHVLVLDNASTDGTQDWLKSKRTFNLHSAYYTRQEALSSVWNAGLRWFWGNSYSPILVLNNDVEIRPDTYSILRSILRESDFGFVTGVGVNRVDHMNEMEHSVQGLIAYSSPHPTFSCFMIDKGTYSTVGPFDEKFYPAYCEDQDYHVRMHRAGIKAMSVPLPFLHHGSQTVANASDAEANAIRQGADKCRLYFKEKYGCMPGTAEYEKLFA